MKALHSVMFGAGLITLVLFSALLFVAAVDFLTVAPLTESGAIALGAGAVAVGAGLLVLLFRIGGRAHGRA